jgi:general stress protein YciG
MSSENRGLASADGETRERVASEGGEARVEYKESLREAGRKGGEK